MVMRFEKKIKSLDKLRENWIDTYHDLTCLACFVLKKKSNLYSQKIC